MADQSMSTAPAAAAPSNNERLLAALAYVLWPFVSAFILLAEEHKNKAFERYHAIQALGAGVALGVLCTVISIILSITVIGVICIPLPMIAVIVLVLYWAYQAYQGKMFEVPYLTQFMRQQKWL